MGLTRRPCSRQQTSARFIYRRTWKQYPILRGSEKDPMHKLRLTQRQVQGWWGLTTELRLEQRLLRAKDGNGVWRAQLSSEIWEMLAPRARADLL
jgi:hypothetical protein